MLAGDFLAVLRILNPKLRVCSLGDNGRMAGIYYIDSDGGYQDVCAIDKNFIPEFPAYDADGHLVKAGWRRAVFILLQRRLTTTRCVRRLWPGFFMRREPPPYIPPKDSVQKTLEGTEDISTEQIHALAEQIRKKDSPAVQEQREHDRWFLQTWRKNGGGAADKPVY